MSDYANTALFSTCLQIAPYCSDTDVLRKYAAYLASKSYSWFTARLNLEVVLIVHNNKA